MPHIAMSDQAIISGPGKVPSAESAIPDFAADLLKASFPSRAEKHNVGGDLISITVARRDLRARILKDQTFRRTFRELPVHCQDLYVRRAWAFWGKGGLGERMSAKTYVSDVKALGQSRGALLGESLAGSIRALQERLESMGRLAQGAVLLGTLALTVGSLVYLAKQAATIITQYSEALSEAASSDAALEKAIQARSGVKPAPQGTSVSESNAPKDSEGNKPRVEKNEGLKDETQRER